MKYIYTFPYIIYKKNKNFEAYDIKHSLKIHKTLLSKLNKCKVFIPEFDYINKPITIDVMENISEYKDIFNGERLVDNLIIYESKNIAQDNILTKSKEIESLLYSLNDINSNLVNKETINNLINKNSELRLLNKRKIVPKNEFKSLRINDRDVSLSHEWLKNISKSDQWLISIIELFKEITEIGLLINCKCFADSYEENQDNIHPLDYFIFTQDAKLKYFIGFNSISYNYKYLNNKSSNVHILENNLRAFANLVKSVFSYYYTNFRDYNFPHKSAVMRVHERFKNNTTGFISFDEVLNIINNERIKESNDKIGVFLDTENIYVGMRSLDIDFNHLFTSIYGIDALKQIKYKIATIVYPTYKSKLKTLDKHNLRDKLKANLESYGFDVKRINLEGSKANQLE